MGWGSAVDAAVVEEPRRAPLVVKAKCVAQRADRFQEGLVTGAAASSASASGRFDVGAISVVEVEELVRRPVSTRW